MTQDTSMVIEIKFSRKGQEYTSKVRALHNGFFVKAKATYTGTMEEVFEQTSQFFETWKGTNSNLQKGIIEDNYIKFIEQKSEQDKESIKSENEQIPEDLQILIESYHAYDKEIEIFAKYRNFENMLLTLKNKILILQEIKEESKSVEKLDDIYNFFDFSITVAREVKQELVEIINKFIESESNSEIPVNFELKVYKNRLKILNSSNKFTIEFDSNLDKGTENMIEMEQSEITQ